MKRLIAAAVLAAAVAALLFTGRFISEKYCDEITSLVTEAQIDYFTGNKESAAQNVDRAQRRWKDAEGLLLIFLNRDGIDEISLSLTRLSSYTKNGSDILFDAESRLCVSLIEHLHETEHVLVF